MSSRGVAVQAQVMKDREAGMQGALSPPRTGGSAMCPCRNGEPWSSILATSFSVIGMAMDLRVGQVPGIFATGVGVGVPAFPTECVTHSLKALQHGSG